MKMLLTICLLLVPTVALASDLNLKLSSSEAELVWKGLRKLPVEDVEVLMTKLRSQVTEQQQAQQAAQPSPTIAEPAKDK